MTTSTNNNGMRTLFVLANSVWDADDYLNDRNTDPKNTDLYLFSSKEEAEKKAHSLYVDNEIYNDGTIYSGKLSEEEILEITQFDTIEEFDDALAEPYSDNVRIKNLGEDEKGEVAREIINNATDYENIECNNYDFKKTLKGSILVFWRWERYIGYARKCIEVRYAYDDEKEELLAKQDSVAATQCDILLSAEEVAAADDIKEAVRVALQNRSWKWQNTSFVESQIKNF